MKRFFICLLCLAITASVFTKPLGLLKVTDVEQVKLSGQLPKGPKLKSAVSFLSIQAYLNTNYLKLEFLASLGNLTITVTNGQGAQVYRNTANATAGGSLNIATQTWANGLYTLTISDNNGGYLEGMFEINR